MAKFENLMARLSIERGSTLWTDCEIAWQASRLAALEEAATVVSDHNRKGREWVADSLWGNLANECASRIRALAAGDKNG